MPGLFGMVSLNGKPLDRGAMSSLLDEMADRLQHLGGERMELWCRWQAGFAVGRVGLPHLLFEPWPPAPAERAGASIPGLEAPAEGGEPASVDFLDGVLHADAPRPEDLRREAEPSDEEMARRLEGFWSAVFYRPARGHRPRSVSLVVDRRAQRPLYWLVRDGVLFFAPEVKVLLAVPGVRREPDPGALGLFFASGFLLADQTFFPDIHRLEGGTLLRLEGEEPRLVRYAEYRFEVEGDGTPYEEMKRLLAEGMRKAVQRNYGDPERDLVFLSGGKDSRIILASAAESVADPSTVRAVSWTSNDPEPGSDVYLARQIADHVGARLDVVRRTVESFGSKALRLNYVLDGLTDVGAFHGEELELMEALARQGVRRVLRGDQCFTRGRAMLDPAYAILRMCIRSTSGLGDGKAAWRPEAYARVSEAGDAVIRGVEAEYAEVQEDNTGDQVYFRHRLQGYLNSAVYFKHLVLDHRNPLLDEGLLRLIQRLSVAARSEQRVLNETGAEYFGNVWNPFPFAERSNLEDFVDLLSRDTPVRRAVRRELEDNDSVVWDHLDRRSLLARLDGLGSSHAEGGLKSRLKKAVKNVVVKAVYDIPAVDTRLRGVYLRRATRHDEVLLRALTLKHVFDLFVTGDGSRGVYESRLSRLEEAEAAEAGADRSTVSLSGSGPGKGAGSGSSRALSGGQPALSTEDGGHA